MIKRVINRQINQMHTLAIKRCRKHLTKLSVALNPIIMLNCTSLKYYSGAVSEALGGNFRDGAISGAMVHLFNHESRDAWIEEEHQKFIEEWGDYTLPPEQQSALLSGTFSLAGAVVSAPVCELTLVSCGLTLALIGDASRNFSVAITGKDPIVTMGMLAGMSDSNARGLATATNFTMAAFSTTKAFQQTIIHVGAPLTRTIIGTAALDTSATINTFYQLQKYEH